MKMKVSVAKLKAAIVKHQKDDETRFAKEQAKFDEAESHNAKLYIENVADYLRELRSGKKAIDGYNIREWLTRGFKSSKAPHAMANYGDLLKKLDLCVTETVTVDDKSEYMRFLSGKCVC